MQRLIQRTIPTSTSAQRGLQLLSRTTTPTSHFCFSTRSTPTERNHLIVVGSGVAGCATALVASHIHSIPTTLLYAGSAPTDCNSYWAQGGIIYRNYEPSSGDSIASLVEDIRRAGAGKCKDDAVWKLSTEGPGRIRQLLLDDEHGAFANVPFDRDDDGELLCCLEASHSTPRIIHYGDQSGKAITEHITRAALSHPLIHVVPNTLVTDLITDDNNQVCIGVETYNKKTRQRERMHTQQGVVLATGGLCGIYEHSTNPVGFNALGSSVALALRSQVHTSDLEYVQFHPTVLYIPGEPRFLLTEALRGVGAVLRDRSGYKFGSDFHPMAELAPRDIVARGVYQKLIESKEHNVFLDASHLDPSLLQRRFPSIQAYLSEWGLDLSRDALPITPAAHYTCGGVTTDLNGSTSLRNLYAAGEAARTGVHGANRLASTSLLEALVFGASCADFIASTASEESRELAKQKLSSLSYPPPHQPHPSKSITHHNAHAAKWLLTKLRQTLWNNVGVVRTPSDTQNAAHILSSIRSEACELYQETCIEETIMLRDAAFSGEAVARAASLNRDSHGAHYMMEDNVPRVEEEWEEDVLMEAFS